MTRIGTSHFTSYHAALSYYWTLEGDVSYAEVDALVRSKVCDGEIHIGPPPVGDGARLITIDGGARYAIEEMG